jgi:hypothetical protein
MIKIAENNFEYKVYFLSENEHSRSRENYIVVEKDVVQPVINIPATGNISVESTDQLIKAIKVAVTLANRNNDEGID